SRPADSPLAPHLEALNRTLAASASQPRQSDLGPRLDALREAIVEVGASRQSDLGPRLDALREAVFETVASRQDDVGQRLDALREAVLQAGASMKSAPPPDLRPVLQKLTEVSARPPVDLSPAIGQLAHVAEAMAARAQASQVDLTPVLRQLTELTKLVLERPPPGEGSASLAPLLERLAAQQAAAGPRAPREPGPQPVPDEVRRQLSTLSETLSPIAAAARNVLQVDADGAMKAVVVWQQVNEAIALVRALEDRLSGRPRRRQGG
ncbi:MAG: hypothetical protein INH37_24900, partial [Myxococcaceae bacterium]|nr:hypothetical protein [Myxococcaceae bacterium]